MDEKNGFLFIINTYQRTHTNIRRRTYRIQLFAHCRLRESGIRGESAMNSRMRSHHRHSVPRPFSPLYCFIFCSPQLHPPSALAAIRKNGPFVNGPALSLSRRLLFFCFICSQSHGRIHGLQRISLLLMKCAVHTAPCPWPHDPARSHYTL